ncbi:MFS transporter [Pseudonocardia acaciae]|uniref:MFS transporter n=1 Tax=Pseudonocardia acaciae TaxID=551276 RepID=UPI00055AACBF|nr:MFS transporter [Pseudonocardia acaciae]
MNPTTVPSSEPSSPPTPSIAQGRRATRGASMGFAVDSYDIYLPVVAVGPALSYFMPSSSLSPGTVALLNGMVFAATLLGRPLGAVIFGSIADSLGRRRATLIAMYGSGVGTLALALMPGYQLLGIGAMIGLILLRLVTGVFLGGQYTGAVPLAMESSPKPKRGLYGGLITMGFPIAFCTVSAVTFSVQALNSRLSEQGAYQQWGWRIPVLIGAIVTFAFAYYYQRTVDESPAWRERGARKGPSPLAQLLRGDSARSLRQVLILMSGAWLCGNATSASYPVALRALDDITPESATAVLVIAEVVLIAAYPLCGALSQRIGRRRFLSLCGIVAATVAPAFYCVLVSNLTTSFVGRVLLTAGLFLSAICCFGSTASYLSERFRTDLRATGYGVGYSMALIVASFYAFYEGLLAEFMPQRYTTAVVYVIGGLLLLVGALRGPETKDVDLTSDTLASTR